MPQQIFKESYIGKISKQLRAGDSKTVALVKRAPLLFDTADVVTVEDYPDLSSVSLLDEDQAQDWQLRNSVALYQALPITPFQASDPCLWSFLTLVTFRAYMEKLRSDVPDDDKAAGRYLLAHYFCPGSSVKDLLLNDISLLWWAAYLTVQPDEKDPYTLTKEVFKMLDYTRHLLPGTQGRSPAFRHAVLEFVVENPDLFKNYREGKVRLIMRRLNMLAGYQLFPIFEKSEIKQYIEPLRAEIQNYTEEKE
jgi:hypothetical protein